MPREFKNLGVGTRGFGRAPQERANPQALVGKNRARGDPGRGQVSLSPVRREDGSHFSVCGPLSLQIA